MLDPLSDLQDPLSGCRIPCLTVQAQEAPRRGQVLQALDGAGRAGCVLFHLRPRPTWTGALWTRAWPAWCRGSLEQEGACAGPGTGAVAGARRAGAVLERPCLWVRHGHVQRLHPDKKPIKPRFFTCLPFRRQRSLILRAWAALSPRGVDSPSQRAFEGLQVAVWPADSWQEGSVSMEAGALVPEGQSMGTHRGVSIAVCDPTSMQSWAPGLSTLVLLTRLLGMTFS